MTVVIDWISPEYPQILCNADGDPAVFADEAEARAYADEVLCHDFYVVVSHPLTGTELSLEVG